MCIRDSLCSGGGPSAQRFEHFQMLLRHSQGGFEAFHRLSQSLVTGTFLPPDAADPLPVPPLLRRLMSSCLLNALSKSRGGVRPISVGESWRRLLAGAVIGSFRGRLREVLQPIQFGVSVSGGAELMAAGVTALKDENPTWVDISTDVGNAFNSVLRSAILDAVHHYVPQLAALVDLTYREHGELLISIGGEVAVVLSQRGAQQGDPLGSALFSLAIHRALE